MGYALVTWPFQSQARSQSSGDVTLTGDSLQGEAVSISGEKPVLWRRRTWIRRTYPAGSFNLRREASPLATPLPFREARRRQSFNLRREASPLATAQLAGISLTARPCFNLRREASPLAT